MVLTMADASWKFTDNREWRDHFRRWPPVIISCAITGGVHNKTANPNLPESPEEQAESTYGVYKAGGTLVHIHARDPRTNYTAAFSATAADFYKVNHLVREKCPDIVINDTGANGFNIDDQEEMDKFFKAMNSEVASLDVGALYMRMAIKAKPEQIDAVANQMKSLGATVSVDSATGLVTSESVMNLGYTKTEMLAKAMKKSNIKAELEVFNTASWWFVDNLIKQKLVDPPYWCQLVFGQDGACSPPTVMTALDMIENMPPQSIFSAIGIGPLQLPITTLGLIMGGHIRVGMEDNVYYRRGEKAKSNAQLVERAVRMCHELNREVATPAQAREMLGLSATPKQYP